MADTPFNPETFEGNPTALEGLTVVITGTLAQLDRKQAETLVERAGGKATGSISSKTNLLVAGEKAGSKLQKAEKLGIEVLDEEGFIARIQQQTNSKSSSFTNHPKGYADWGNIEPFNNEELEMQTGARDDLDINNLTSIFYHSCQHFNYDRLQEGVVQYYFDSLGDEEREAEMKDYQDKGTGDIMVLESAIDTYLGALNKDEKQELYKKLIKPEDTSVNPEALKTEDQPLTINEKSEEMTEPSQHTDEKLTTDHEVVLAAVKEKGYALKDFAVELKADREIVFAAVQSNGGALYFAHNSLKSDREIVLAAVKENGYSLEYAAVELKADREVVLAAVKTYGDALEYADDELKADREVVLEAVEQNSEALKYAAVELKADREIVLAAVRRNGYSLEYADDSLMADREFALGAVNSSGWLLKYAAVELKADKEIVLAAVKSDGFALKDADENLKADREVVLAAVKSEGRAMKYADEKLIADLKEEGLIEDN